MRTLRPATLILTGPAMVLGLVFHLHPATNADSEVRDVLVNGRIVEVGDGGKWFDLKAGSSTIRVTLRGAKLEKHSVLPLQEVNEGVMLHVFAHLQQWSDAPDELENIMVLVGGDYARPEFRNEGGRHNWYSGHLRFGSNKTVAWCGDAQLFCGVDRPVCMVARASLKDFFETDEDGEKKARTILVRGKYSKREIDGEKRKTIAARVVTLPTTGIKRKEYGYILDPEKLHAKKAD